MSCLIRQPLMMAVPLLLSVSAVQAEPSLEVAAAPTVLPEVVVEGQRPSENGALESARESIRQTPGGVDLVPAERFEDVYALNLREVLRYTPGVFAQPRFAEETRLSIRGSGLGRSNHLRGVLLLLDGVPINLPDGFGDFQELDPLSVRYAEVYKGGNGLRYGSSALGGAINFAMPTGRSAAQPNLLRLEGGSFDTYREHLAVARAYDQLDFYAAATANQAEGFRDQSRTDNRRFNGNVGYRFGNGVETRFYLNANDINQQIPGTISYDAALDDPESVVPTSKTFDTGRDVDSVRLSNRTSLALGGGLLETGGYFFHKKLYHPITGIVIDHEGDFYGAFAQWRRDAQLAGLRNELTLGARWGSGHNNAKVFANVNGGQRGAQSANADEKASEANLYAENRLWLVPSVALIVGGQGISATRDYTDNVNPAESETRHFDGVSPKVGVLWQADAHTQVFANVNRSFEPPIFGDLNQNSAVGTCAGTGAGGFADIDAQKAWTAELGTRGERGRVAWDVSLYRAEIRDEVLQKACSPTNAIQFNADDTVHQGIEAGLNLRLVTGALASGDTLSLQQVYAYADFRFEGDAVYGDNSLAGQPRHHYQVFLRYEHPSGFFIAPGLERGATAFFADYANSFALPAYTVWNLSTGLDLPGGVSLFLEGRNLADERYIGSVSATTDYATATNRNIFYPGEGRAVYGGLRWALGS